MATSKKKKTATSKKPNGPVAKVWSIFTKHPKATRKDQLAAAASAGINEYTARTQYQRWLHRGAARFSWQVGDLQKE